MKEQNSGDDTAEHKKHLCDTCKHHDRKKSLCNVHYKCWQAKVNVGCDGYEEVEAKSKQVGGDHYASLKIQPWDAMQAWLTREQFVGFLLGSATAYIARFNTRCVDGKGGRQDIEKAKHYLDKLLEVIGIDEKHCPICVAVGVYDANNDHLIAAAPEMYGMLEKILRDHAISTDKSACCVFGYVSEIEQLLKGARGEQ